MPSLTDFMESLTREEDKMVQMGAIKPTKDQYLAIGDSKYAKEKKNIKYTKQ